MPKVRSLTGGAFGEPDPTSWRNSVLAAKSADETITYDQWMKEKYELFKHNLNLEGKEDVHLHSDEVARRKLFRQVWTNDPTCISAKNHSDGLQESRDNGPSM